MVHLSPKHGLNASLSLCFYCQQEKNEIVFPGLLRGTNDAEARRKAVWDEEPCDACKGHMAQGVILISVDEKLTGEDTNNPYRTGGWCVVTDDFIKRVVDPPGLLRMILKKRVAFIPDDAWKKLGLPSIGGGGPEGKKEVDDGDGEGS